MRRSLWVLLLVVLTGCSVFRSEPMSQRERRAATVHRQTWRYIPWCKLDGQQGSGLYCTRWAHMGQDALAWIEAGDPLPPLDASPEELALFYRLQARQIGDYQARGWDSGEILLHLLLWQEPGSIRHHQARQIAWDLSQGLDPDALVLALTEPYLPPITRCRRANGDEVKLVTQCYHLLAEWDRRAPGENHGY